jgi:tetratricopeptide (TPR) repeat protein
MQSTACLRNFVGYRPADGHSAKGAMRHPRYRFVCELAEIDRLRITARRLDMKLRLFVIPALLITVAWARSQGRPSEAKAHYDRAVALNERGDVCSAIGEYREAIRQAPDIAALRYNFGLVLVNRGDLDGAIHEFREAVELQPGDAAGRPRYF